jgi:simple sugar transport system substrate-binding protein
MTDEPHGFDRARLLRALAVTGATAAIAPSELLAATDSFPQPHPRWRFVFVNHATTNPFFVPTLYGIGDAGALIGTTYEWTGSKRSDVREMVAAMRRAIHDRVDGIAVSLIDRTAFDAPTAEALRHGIPVVAYNADGGRANRRLSYVGQDLYQSGLEVGARIAQLVGHGEVAIFIATPGQLNIQPRVDGAVAAIRDSGKPIRVRVVATGTDVREEYQRIERTYLRNKSLRGLFAVDGGSTAAVAAVVERHGLHRKGVHAGGYDLLAGTLRGVAAGRLDFTVDQQPYLQGFLPVLQLFLSRYSGGLVSPADTNTGHVFVTARNVKPYVATRSRFEGSSSVRRFPPAKSG